MGSILRRTYEIRGVVQGVGFRPALYRLAEAKKLGGYVQNRSGSVRLVLEGQAEELDSFINNLPKNIPPQARIESLEISNSEELLEAEGSGEFKILDSESIEDVRISFPADLALCSECQKEILDPEDRRYGYPFTTCTDCGPRYTVINSMPYDRERTTLNQFPLCDECEKEYLDPKGRRFHAESIACPKCGPKLWLTDSNGKIVHGKAIQNARDALTAGKIVAVRGIGGFLLAVDAFNEDAIRELRESKSRPDKPFAVMARDLGVIRQYCQTTPSSEMLLKSPEAPIVICDLKDKGTDLPLELLSPDVSTLGVMLPTSPLHWVLFNPLLEDPIPSFNLLVMTSGNRRSEPICISNEEALERLSGIADLFLFHDREINLRADDSLYCTQQNGSQVWRRGRGLTPGFLKVKNPLDSCVLAMGAEQKNAVALGDKEEIILSPHVGDLETPEAIAGLEQVTDCFPEFFKKMPEIIAVDLHPDYHSSRLGRRLAEENSLKLVQVQHHYAHIGACMAENQINECLGLSFDGTGLGTDGTIWGAELLHADLDGYSRLGTFKAVPLPGGDVAVRDVSRQVVGRWIDAGYDPVETDLLRLNIAPEEYNIWRTQVERGINSPLSHAAGRVFDSFSYLIGVLNGLTTYDGQAAIRLEAAAKRCPDEESITKIPILVVERENRLEIDWKEAFIMLSDPSLIKGNESSLAYSVHLAIAEAAVTMVDFALSRVSIRTVALTGGCFMNRILFSLVKDKLKEMGLEVISHHLIPPNDGGVAAGQAYLAR